MTNSRLVVSVGMPVHNGAKFIHEALNSLLTQTFANFELIISDNASTDETETICRKYAEQDDRIRYFRQAENFGAAANFKFVLNEARGEYFMWSAADDVWDNNWIEALLPVSVASQCLAYGMVQTIDRDGHHIQHPPNRRRLNFTGPKLIRRFKYFLEPSFLGKANPIYGIYPKKFLTTHCLSLLDSREPGADMLLLYRILADIEIKGGLPVFLYKRIHDSCAGNAGTQSVKRKKSTLRIMELTLNVMLYQYRLIACYRSLSNIFERYAQILLTPIIFIINIYFFVVNGRQSRRK